MTTGTMTGCLDRLEQRGWLERVPSTRDRRSLDVELTAEGKNVVDEALTRHAAGQAEVMDALSAADRRDLDRIARKLIAHQSPGQHR